MKGLLLPRDILTMLGSYLTLDVWKAQSPGLTMLLIKQCGPLWEIHPVEVNDDISGSSVISSEALGMILLILKPDLAFWNT